MSIAYGIAGPIVGSVDKRVTEPGEVGGSTGLADGASITLATAFAGDTDPAWATTTVSGSRYRRTSGGALELLGSNTPRLHTVSGGTGLLVEPATPTNLLTYSQQFDNAAWTKNSMTVSANAATAPDGNATAELIYPTTTGLGRSVYSLFTASDNTDYTFPLFIKPNNFDWAKLVIRQKDGTYVRSWFNVSAGSVGTVESGGSAEIDQYISGYWRCALTVNVGVGGFPPEVAISTADGDNDNTSTTNGTDGIYIWQADLVAAAAPFSPILTTSGTGIRAADSIVIDCTHASINVPDGDTLRFTDTDSNTSDVVVASGSVTIPNSSWQAPWVTMTRVAA